MKSSPCLCCMLSIWAKMISNKTLSRTGNTYRTLLEGCVAIAPIYQFVVWRAQHKRKVQSELPSQWTKPQFYCHHRLIAFPVHIEAPLHFTLGIMVNLKWNRLSALRGTDWVLLHFDSCHSSPTSQRHALGFGRYLAELDSKAKVRVFEVPLVRQPTNSNDCGFYPSYVLDIILRDIDYYIQRCMEVCNISASRRYPLANF